MVVAAEVARGEPSPPVAPTTSETVATPMPATTPMMVWGAGAGAPSQAGTGTVSAPKPAPSEGGVHQATTYLTRAVRALRVEHAPKTALLLLNRHADELERNGFAREALLLRVEAMLALGRQDEVLRLLDSTPLTDGTGSRALLVMRGQLRAAANRCPEGLGDFNFVLAEAGRPPKPALLGRALCRKKLGDSEGAKTDLDRYRKEFPGDGAADDPERPAAQP